MKYSVYALLVSVSQSSRQQTQIHQRAAVKLNDLNDDPFEVL